MLLKSAMAKPSSSIESLLRVTSRTQVEKNRHAIKSLADTVLVCGQQCFALRGHRDDNTADDEVNRGNLISGSASIIMVYDLAM